MNRTRKLRLFASMVLGEACAGFWANNKVNWKSFSAYNYWRIIADSPQAGNEIEATPSYPPGGQYGDAFNVPWQNC